MTGPARRRPRRSCRDEPAASEMQEPTAPSHVPESVDMAGQHARQAVRRQAGAAEIDVRQPRAGDGEPAESADPRNLERYLLSFGPVRRSGPRPGWRWRDMRCYCSVTPAILTASPQSVISLAMKAENCAGSGVGRIDAILVQLLDEVAGPSYARASSPATRSMTGLGVPAGATMPVQDTAWKPAKPNSAMVGTSGACARASRSTPPACGFAGARLRQRLRNRHEHRRDVAGDQIGEAAPCRDSSRSVISRPARLRNSDIRRLLALPGPPPPA